jgi:4-hydroxybenzoate polyprenyltransferase
MEAHRAPTLLGARSASTLESTFLNVHGEAMSTTGATVTAFVRTDAPAESRTSGRLRLVLALAIALRPRQWAKNGLLFVPLVFALDLFNRDSLLRSSAAFVLFCALASAGYMLNDVADIEADRQHPTKCRRPIAAGLVSTSLALVLGVLLAAAGVAGCWAIEPKLGLLALAYLVTTAAYTKWLKHMVLLDVFGLASGFVIRAAAGAVAIGVPISPWLYAATMLGALLIGLGKRRSELVALGSGAGDHRRNLNTYTIEFVDQLILIISGAAVMTYALYTFSAENLPRDHTMMLTIPVVLYGLFRYLFLIRASEIGGAPEDLLFRDGPLLGAVATWVALSMAILYASVRV